jgi:hypothetical protein
MMNAPSAWAQYNSHDPTGQIRALLEPMVKSRLGEDYSTKYQVIDSLIGDFGDDLKEEVLDDVVWSARHQQ